LTVFIFAVFHETREIDLFTRITRHKLPETLIFASVYERFTPVGPNRANRPLTDRESHLRSGHHVWVPTAVSMDRGVMLLIPRACELVAGFSGIFFRMDWFGNYFENFSHAEKNLKFSRSVLNRFS